MTAEAPTRPQPELTQAPPLADGEGAKAVAPSTYSAEFLIETSEGYHVLIRGENLSPRDVMVWTKNASAELARQGFKRVRRDFSHVSEKSPAEGLRAAPPAGWDELGPAYKIPGEGDAPPRCSKHGPMKWVEGDKDGRHYAFWGCSERGCRPKERKG